MITLRKEAYEPIESDYYVAELKDLQDGKPGQYGPSLKFSFRLLEEPYVGRPVTGMCNASWKPGNKLDRWLSALGITAPEGTELTEDQVNLIKGRRVRVLVETDEKTGFANVKNVKPLSAAHTEGSQAAPAITIAPANTQVVHTSGYAQVVPTVQAPVAPAPVVAPVVAPTPVAAPVIVPKPNRTIPF